MTISYNQARAVSKAAGYYLYVCPYTAKWCVGHRVVGFMCPRTGYKTERDAWLGAFNALNQSLKQRGIDP